MTTIGYRQRRYAVLILVHACVICINLSDAFIMPTRNSMLSIKATSRTKLCDRYSSKSPLSEAISNEESGCVEHDIVGKKNTQYLLSSPYSSRRDATKHTLGLLMGGLVASFSKPATDLSHAEEENNNSSSEESPNVSSSMEPYHVALDVQIDPQRSGTIIIEVLPSWGPLAAARFKELVELGFYDDAKFFRVLPGYVAQFGIASDPALNKEWLLCGKNCKAMQDEPRKESNKKGTLSFATSGKNTRQTQIFINLGNNGGAPNFLDGQGFVPFARVVEGMDNVVKKLNSEYGIMESVSGGLAGSVNQGKAAYYGKEYLDTLFPKLSFIRTAKVI